MVDGFTPAGSWKAKWIGKEAEGDDRDPHSPYWNLKAASWIEPSAPVGAGEVFFRFGFDVPQDRKVVDAVAVLGGDRGGDFNNRTRVSPFSGARRSSAAGDTYALYLSRHTATTCIRPSVRFTAMDGRSRLFRRGIQEHSTPGWTW